MGAVLIMAGVWGAPARAVEYQETPMFKDDVAAGKLPPVAERLPEHPAVIDLKAMGRTIGKPGGELHTLIGPPKDTKLLVVYGYARLVGYDQNFNLVPDIAESYDVKDGRIFTFKLRKGHKWSNGDPFTAEDFRYYWEDVANNRELSPSGPPRSMLVNGKPPKFEVIDAQTVRYTWDSPNPFFLHRLAGAAPLFIYRPSAYLKQFHKTYADPEKIKALIEKARMRSWAPLHNRLDNMYKFNNPDLPTLQPWRIRTRPPASRFIGERNPYFHRVDTAGHQLPYIDRMVLISSDTRLVPAKAGTGEIDLQARGLAFKDYAFLKQNEERFGFKVYLWSTAKGSQMALYPNLNVNDDVWRKLMRDVRFRRALSLGIDREIINETLYFGLAAEGNNTVLPQSPLYEDKYREEWATYDPDKANELLDEIGLTKRNDDDLRLLPDGRPMEIIVETAGEDTEQTDILELIRETWAELGIKLISNPSQRQVFRNRIFSGESMMSVWSGLENAVVTPDMSPAELAPTSQMGLQWPKWGQYYETSGQSGEAPDMKAGERLAALNKEWNQAQTTEERAEIWHEMLQINASQQLTIGVVSQVKQPIVVRNRLHNVPKEGVYNWDPGSQFGCYRPDTFWLDPVK
jgi:peptide/nickel transport system substrate-binding protein